MKDTKNIEFDILSKKIIGCTIEEHKTLVFVPLESTYKKCLSCKLFLNNSNYSKQVLNKF